MNNVQQSSCTAAASEDNPSSNSFPDAGYPRLGNSRIQPQDREAPEKSTAILETVLLGRAVPGVQMDFLLGKLFDAQLAESRKRRKDDKTWKN